MGVSQADASGRETVTEEAMGATGLELLRKTRRKLAIRAKAAQNAARLPAIPPQTSPRQPLLIPICRR
jgi:hypothetical protein